MDFPLYVEEMAKNAVERLRMLPQGNSVDFAFITDTHNCIDYTERALYAVKEINKSFPIEYICLGGDYLCNNSYTDRNEAIHQHSELAEVIKKYSDELPIIVIKGNHDDNPFGKPENMLCSDEIYDIIMSHQKNIWISDESTESAMYGYFDMPKKKFRAVYLNVFDPEYMRRGNKIYYKDNCANVIGSKQINWLANTALILPSSDWSVAVFAHCLPVPTPFLPTERFFGGNAIIEILSAFKNGMAYSENARKNSLYYDVNCDFLKQGEGNLVGYFCGHYHNDWKWKVSGINIISQLAIASDNFCTGVCLDGTRHFKTKGSGEESAFSIYRVYLDKKEVYSIRCGAGPDFSFKY